MALVLLHSIKKTYQSGNTEVKAVCDFNLSIDKGEFTVLAGPSGSGKTTVLNMVGAIDQPTSGNIHIEGVNLQQASAKKLADFRLHRVGFIFQSYNLIPVLSAAENAEFVLMMQGVAATQRRQRVSELFLQLGIDGLEDRRPSDLSGGQQQRVAIARAMAAGPAIILADEPTANLDSDTSAALLDLMRTLNDEEGVTFLFSSHDPMVIARAKRVVELKDGHLIKDTANN